MEYRNEVEVLRNMYELRESFVCPAWKTCSTTPARGSEWGKNQTKLTSSSGEGAKHFGEVERVRWPDLAVSSLEKAKLSRDCVQLNGQIDVQGTNFEF